MRIRVLVVDDHAIVRAGLCSLLDAEGGFQVVGEASNADEASHLAQETRPDVAVMDLSMPTVSGFEAIRRVLEVSPATKIVVLSMHEDEHYVLEAIQAGASGYLVKGSPPGELYSAIRAASGGDAYFCPAVAKQLLNTYLHRLGHKSEPEGAFYALSPREREVVRLIAEGLTSREIGARLFLSANTVERHRANIMEKLQLHNRAQLVKFAIKHGLVALET